MESTRSVRSLQVQRTAAGRHDIRLARWAFGPVVLLVIRKVETSESGLVLQALADPINVAIVDELLAVYSATPGALAASVHRSLGISRPVISTHLTQLRQRRIVRILGDGSMSLRDPGPVVLVLQTARDFAKAGYTEGARDESAAHYRTQRRINKTLRQLKASDGDFIEPRDGTEAIAASPSATVRYTSLAAEDHGQPAIASTETTSDRVPTDSDRPPVDRSAMSQAEIEQIRRIHRASFPFKTPWPSQAERRAVARERWSPQSDPSTTRNGPPRGSPSTADE